MSKKDKYINNLNSDAFLRASTINTRLSLLGRELNENIDNLVLDEVTLGQVFKKQNLNNKTIYSSNKYKINFDNLVSDEISSNDILLEEKQKTILFKGQDENEQLTIIEEVKEDVKNNKKKNQINIYEDVTNDIEKKEQIKTVGGTTLFDEIYQEKPNSKEEKSNLNDENNNVNISDNNKFMRASTLFQNIFDFNQELKEINDIEIENLNKKQQKKNNDLRVSNIFSNLIPEEKKTNKNKEEDLKTINENKKDEEILEKIEEEDKKKDVLKKEYYPIDVIEEAEKYYNLSNESDEDLYPLNTYTMNNGLSIDFINYTEIKLNTQASSPITAMGLDDKNNVYLCTKNGKIIKKEKEKEKIISNEKYNKNITCVDIFENIIATGDETGNIILWIDNTINQALVNLTNKNKILYIKIIEVNSKIILIFSDDQGNLYLINVNPSKIGEFTKMPLLNNKDMPIYNMIIFPNSKLDIKNEKKYIFIIFVTSQTLELYKLNLKEIDMNKLGMLNYFYGEKGKHQFDISLGYGFPPVSDLKNNVGSISARSGSISDNIIIGDDEEKNRMLAVSYGNLIQLYGVRVSENDGIIYKPIGFFLTEKPIIRLFFICNSMLALITDNFYVKLINTYDFIPRIYNPKKDLLPTKNCLISYELLNISKFGISGQEFEIGIENKTIKKNMYTNNIISIENGLLFIGKDLNKYYQCSLLKYVDIIYNLSEKEDYIKMLWLSLIIFNKNPNLLNKQLDIIEKDYIKKNKTALYDSCVMRFFIKKVIPGLSNNNEVYAKMILEFLMETNYFDILPDYITMLSNYGLDKYIYINLTKYIANGKLYEFLLNSKLLNKYIDYYCQQNEKLLLNKVLLKLNLDTLLQPEILKNILEKELINPYIYTRIKNIQAGKIDYFLPAEYLDVLFKKDIIKEKYEIEKQNEEKIKATLTPEQLQLYEEQIKEKKKEMEKDIKERNEIEIDYKKLIIEHNMDFFNEKTFTCHGYLGHKFLWYCNKCISGKEYPNDTQMSPNNFKETAIKILAYLVSKENIKLYLEFDSYTYLQIISKYFTEQQLFKLIHKEDYCSNEEMFSKSEKEVIDKYLGNKRSESFNGDYIFRAIRNGVKDIVLNKFYVQYDFYIMTCEICSKNSNFFFDKSAVMDVLLFFSEFLVENFPDNDPYNCHRKLETNKEIKQYYNKVEKYMLALLNYLKEHNCLDEEYVKELLLKTRIKKFKKVYFFLCEENKQYKECFQMKIAEYERNPDTYSEKDKKDFFNWIVHILEYTYRIDIINEKVYNVDMEENKEKYHQTVKKIILSYLKVLCEISLDELSKITDNWFYEEDEQEDLIQHLGGGASNTLQLKYIDHLFLLKKNDMNENIEKYMKFLELELDILIKERNRKRIKELLTEYKILCNESTLKKLLSSRINDCSIYICQIQQKIEKGVDLTLIEVKEKFENIIKVIEKPNYNPILIDIELKEMYNYFEMGLSVCQNNFFDQEKEDKKIDDNWLKLFNSACDFKMRFYPRYEENKNNIKTHDYKKIFTNLQSCIQLILEKMSDYITLDLLVEIIANSIGEGKHGKIIEFYIFLDKSFFSFRRTEKILQSGKNLWATSILIKYDELGLLKTKGKHIYLYENRCDFCKQLIKENDYIFKMFECGHKYHLNCCAEEKGEKICFTCRKEEVGDEIDLIEDFKVGCKINKISDSEKEAQENIEKKLEERKKKILMKGRLGVLKKIRKKRREINDVVSGKVAYGMN